MLVEPMAGDSLADNLNPVGRVYYAGSTHICVPTALEQEVGLALGAQAGEKRIGEVRARRRLLAIPQGGRDTVQHDPRGKAVT